MPAFPTLLLASSFSVAMSCFAALSCVISNICIDEPVDSSILQALADLFALQRIHDDILFAHADYVAPDKAKAIQRLIDQLCSELRGVALPLVDAFAIPDHILRAPIGLSASQQHGQQYNEYLTAVGWELGA